MSEIDQRSGSTRSRRLLTRALVVAGATVAGTSAVWLAGSTAWADSPDLPEPPADVSTMGHPTASGGPQQADPGAFPLRDLDPTSLIAAPGDRPDRGLPVDSAGTESKRLLAPVAKPVSGIVRQAGSTLRPVQRAAEAALPDTGLPPGTLPPPVDNGLRELGTPLWSAVDEASPPVQGNQSVPTAEPTWTQSPATIPPAAPQQPAAEETTTPPATPAMSAAAFKPTAPPEPGFPAPARIVILPAAPGGSGSAGSGGNADGHGYNGLGLGWYPTPSFDDRSAGVPTRTGTEALMGLSGPQPGTTPD